MSAQSPTRIVRFEDTCHVIPSKSASSPSRLPKLLTKSISVPVPIWKTSPKSPDTSKSFVLTVPILSTRSPPLPRTQHCPPPSCLASSQRPRGLSDPSSSPSSPSPHPPRRRLSFPEVVPPVSLLSPSPPPSSLLSLSSPSSSSPPPATVPLRPCCEACYSRVDASLAEEHWSFQWSSAAARKHNQSLRSSSTATIFPWKIHADVVLEEEEEEDK